MEHRDLESTPLLQSPLATVPEDARISRQQRPGRLAIGIPRPSRTQEIYEKEYDDPNLNAAAALAFSCSLASPTKRVSLKPVARKLDQVPSSGNLMGKPEFLDTTLLEEPQDLEESVDDFDYQALAKFLASTTPELPDAEHQVLFFSEALGDQFLAAKFLQKMDFSAKVKGVDAIHGLLKSGPFWIDFCDPKFTEVDVAAKVFPALV
jgi:hypothetical protein